MTYYQHLLTEISVSESAVDCSRCEIEWKCCTYRPFIANFLVGSAQQTYVFDEKVKTEWDFLIVGMSPGPSYRKLFSKKGKWGFGTDATLLCSFYHRGSGGCQIWSSRPAVCRTFFCKSSYSEKGSLYWKKAEEFTWMLEWVLLEDFLFTKGWTFEDLRIIKDYLSEERSAQLPSISEDYFLKDANQAKLFYEEAFQHVAGMSEKTVSELIGNKGLALRDELLAEQRNLR